MAKSKTASRAPAIHIGIAEKDRAAITEGLGRLVTRKAAALACARQVV